MVINIDNGILFTLNNTTMKPLFTPTTIVQKEHSVNVIAVIKDNNTVKLKNKEYNISNKSRSIKGLKDYYTILGHALGAGIRLMTTNCSVGENKYCRPYKIGTNVFGKLNDNQEFIINTVAS